VTVALLLLVIVASFLVVRLGAVLLELTGMPWEQAKFQSLSAFSNSGFTTREAEDVMRHPVRRRIVTWLIVIGNAGIVTTIGAFAGSVMSGNYMRTLMAIGLVFAGIMVLFWIARRRAIGTRIRFALEKWLAAHYDFQSHTAEQMLRLGEGYGLTRITLPVNSPAAGKKLKDLDLKASMVQVLAIERHGRFIPIPSGDDKLLAGDEVIVYGVADSIEGVFHPDKAERLSLMFDADGAADFGAQERRR
jgi:TrkA family protein